jgi:hypothetical protein
MRRALIKALIGSATAAFVAVMIGSCGGGGGGDPAPTPTPTPTPTSTHLMRSATLDSTQEIDDVAPNASATGRGAVVVDRTTREITGGAIFSGLSGAPIDAHIHQAAAGVSGGVVIGLTLSADGTTATIPPNTTLSPALLTALEAGNLYFNIHTAANPAGEIRGQITGTTNLTAGLATLNAGQETPPGTSTATGRGTIVLDSATREILICYVTHTVANPTVAHIHTGAVGVPGPANVVDLQMETGMFKCPVTTPRATLTPQQASDLNAGNTYFNVHSNNNLCAPAMNCAAGEIRGQIGVVQ